MEVNQSSGIPWFALNLEHGKLGISSEPTRNLMVQLQVDHETKVVWDSVAGLGSDEGS